jgi:hypothetical protein
MVVGSRQQRAVNEGGALEAYEPNKCTKLWEAVEIDPYNWSISYPF